MAVWYGGGGCTEAKSPYDWRRNDANEGTPSVLDWSNWAGETRADDGRAGDAIMMCDVEEVGVPLRLDSDCEGDLWDEGRGDGVLQRLGVVREEGLDDGREEEGSGGATTCGGNCSEGFDERISVTGEGRAGVVVVVVSVGTTGMTSVFRVLFA